MTIIAAARTSRSVCIGSDSIGSNGDTRSDFGSKLLAFEWGAVGFAGSYAPIQVAEPALRSSIDAVETKHQIRKLVAVLRELFAGAGWVPQAQGDLPELEGLCFLIVGRRGAIWSVFSDFSFLRSRKYAAIGSGEAVALGAMHALHRDRAAPTIVEAGVRAAIKHQTGCGGRYHRVLFSIK